jgi:polysaccharide biosynthesis transport protein
MTHAEEEVVTVRHDRSTAQARFHARLSRYGALLREKWWLLVLGAAAGLGIQAALILRQPASFTSIGRMIVSIKLAIPEGSVYTEELSNFLGTQAALMQSGLVISRARSRVQVQWQEQSACPVSLKVSVLPKTTIFELRATGDNADYVRAFLQACMEEYSGLKKEMRNSTSDTTVAGLTEQVMRLERELRVAEQALVEFQSTNSAVLFQEQGNSTGNYLVGLNQRLASLKSEYALLERLTLEQSLGRELESGGAITVVSDSPEVLAEGATARTDSDYLKAKQQWLLLKAEAEELGRYLKPKHPKMMVMSQEIARREGLLRIYRDQGAEQLGNKKASLALEIQNLEKDVKGWDEKTLATQAKAAEYQKLKANAQRSQTLYDRLLATMQTLDVNKEVSPESVTIMEKASPGFADQLELGKKLAVGGGIGLALSLLLLLILDRMDDRVNSFSELEEAFDEDILGQVPREKAGRPHQLLPLIEPGDARHPLVEAFRGLRSSLLYMAEAGQRPRIMLVTSSVPSDGKSFTAANLAITLAKAGARVLLVDADLRKGEIHSRFGLKSEPGLSEVLGQGVEWESAVQAIPETTLCVLARGSFATNSSELFISEATQRFLRETLAKYDYVVLDTVPVMAADDVTSLAPQVDGVLFVIRALYTSARVARTSLDSLYHRQARILGLIFNAVPPWTMDYYCYKYRDYYRQYPGKGRIVAGKAKAEQKC